MANVMTRQPPVIFSNLNMVMWVRAWRKLWPYDEGKDDDEEEEADIDGAVNEIRDICSTLPGFEQSDKDDAMGWLDVDSNDAGYQILTDQEIADMLNDAKSRRKESIFVFNLSNSFQRIQTQLDRMVTTQKMRLKKQGQHIF
ncbi:hypothetical protein QE152_g29709 [Popillia japonica]|uniref:Uncharacterized protein n=1 Tax=Popillia japonica TaxID=7064 RepID=A0AAW1JH52_POPJA